MYGSWSPGWSAKPLVSAYDRIVGTHRVSTKPGQLQRVILKGLGCFGAFEDRGGCFEGPLLVGGWTPGQEAAFEEVRARLRSLEVNPDGHRVGAEQRRTEEGTVWWVVVGPDRARWLLSWSELEPGVLVVEWRRSVACYSSWRSARMAPTSRMAPPRPDPPTQANRATASPSPIP